MNELVSNNGYYLSPDQLERIEQRLHLLCTDTKAILLVLAEISGQLISEYGEIEEINASILSALAASNLSANKEMARLLGESGWFKFLLHEGKYRHFCLAQVDDNLALIGVFDKQIPIGLIRLDTEKAVKELSEITIEAQANFHNEAPTLPSNLGSLLENEMDSLLG